MVTVPPAAPNGGETLAITGSIAVKSTFELLAIEFTVTVTAPAQAGVVLDTVATICVSLQLVIDAAGAPLNRIELFPWVFPKFEPIIVTDVPTPPITGETLETMGAG